MGVCCCADKHKPEPPREKYRYKIKKPLSMLYYEKLLKDQPIDIYEYFQDVRSIQVTFQPKQGSNNKDNGKKILIQNITSDYDHTWTHKFLATYGNNNSAVIEAGLVGKA